MIRHLPHLLARFRILELTFVLSPDKEVGQRTPMNAPTLKVLLRLLMVAHHLRVDHRVQSREHVLAFTVTFALVCHQGHLCVLSELEV